MLRERGADQQWISVIRMAGLSKAAKARVHISRGSADFILSSRQGMIYYELCVARVITFGPFCDQAVSVMLSRVCVLHCASKSTL